VKNLLTRALTGSLFVAVMIGAICWHFLAFLIVFGLITLLLLWEFYGLAGHYRPVKRFLYSLGGAWLFGAAFAYTHGLADGKVFLPYLLFLMCVLIAELYDKNANPVNNWSIAFFAQVYCAGSLSLLNFMATRVSGESRHISLFVLVLFVTVWLSDTGAYLAGTLWGKHRLFERISPKKSWEGFWGGFVAAVASSQVFACYYPEVSRYHWLGLSVVIVVFAAWGDLAESLLKRTLAVKDSGRILPGHGGMLDRFDSVLLATPAAFIYMELFIRN
jgi:phosphatidate cytidylyltransferase